MSLVDEINHTKLGRGSVAVWWLGQMGYAFKFSDGKVVYIDPYLSNLCDATRLVPVAVPPSMIDNADVVLATHDHDDHTDNGTLPFIALSSPNAVFVGPASSVKKMVEWGIPAERTVTVARGEEKTVAGVKLHATKAVHSPDSVGFVIQHDSLTVYHSGDTLFFAEIKEIGEKFRLDLAFLPINGKWGNFGAPEAVVAGKLLHPKVLIPMHYGMFKENTVEPSIFVEAARAAIPEQKVVLLNYKEKYTYTKQPK